MYNDLDAPDRNLQVHNTDDIDDLNVQNENLHVHDINYINK